VIAATRLRRGAAPSSHGAVRMIRDAITTARRCGAGDNILVRADSAYCSSSILQAVSKAGARFSVGMPLNSAGAGGDRHDRRCGVDPDRVSVGDPRPRHRGVDLGRGDRRDPFTAFASKPAAKHVTARLIVRRIPERNPRSCRTRCSPRGGSTPCSPTTPPRWWPRSRPTAVTRSSSRSSPTSRVPRWRTCPRDKFTANAAWLVCAAIAFNLTRTLGVIAGGSCQGHHRDDPHPDHQPARPHRPLRPTAHLRLPRDWTWAAALATPLDRGHDHLTPSPPPDPTTRGPPGQAGQTGRANTPTGPITTTPAITRPRPPPTPHTVDRGSSGLVKAHSSYL
jgi:hypothetical protein